MTFEEAAEVFAAIGTANKRKFHCPAHKDSRASGWIERGRKRWFVTCFRSCDETAILAAKGLSDEDVWYEPRRNGFAPIEIYRYVDERGAPLFEVGRSAEKEFRARLPGADGWYGGIGKARRVLYRLPQVNAAVEAGKLVFLAAGEKDVHALERAGQVATTMPFGEGKGGWSDDYSKVFKGAFVVVVADKDETGRKHARVVKASLEAVGATVHSVEAKVGKDAHDHLAAGLTVKDFIAVDFDEPKAEKTTEPQPEPLTMTAAEVRSHIIRWLWVGRLAFGYMTVATGLEKIGKSVFWCWVIAGLTRGTLDGGPDGPTDVLIVAREDGIEDMWKPRLDLAGADLPRVHFVRFEALGDDWNVRDGIARLAEAATATNARLVLLDAVLEHMPEPSGGENLNSPTFIRRSLRPLGDLARVGDGLVVVMSMHPPKRPGAEFRDMVQNSQAWTAVSRLGLLFAYHPEDAELPDDERRRVVVRGAGNIGRNPGALAYRIEGRAYLHDDGETQDREMAAEVEPSPVGMRDLQRAAMREGQTDTKTGQAVALIRALLRDGDWRDSADVFAALDAVGVGAKATVAEARKLVGVEVRKAGFAEGWEWRLKSGPQKLTEPSARARTGSVTDRTFDVKKTDPSPRDKGSYEDSGFLTEPLSTGTRSDQGSDGHGPPAPAPAREAAVANGTTPDLLAELQARSGGRDYSTTEPTPRAPAEPTERKDLS